MSNPLLIAAKGKGFLPMLARSRMIVNRYGLTAGKMDAALTALMEPLTHYFCSATIPVTASALASNPGVIKKNSLKGLEFAVHGLHHVDYSQLNLEQQLKHIREARGIFHQLDIPVAGFRCPYLRWNKDTLIALEETGFDYDSSQALSMDVVDEFSTETYHRVLDFYRAQSANDYPALPSWSDNLIRIPYCLPDDEALIDRLHITDTGIMAHIWLAMLDHVYQSGELFTLGLHPERASACQAALHAVLAKARSLSPSVWIARLDEIAAWFRSLGQTTCKIENEGGSLYYVQIIGPKRETVLVRSSEIIAPTQPWDIDYKAVCTNEFFLRSDKRPLVGLTPSSPISLQRFLRCQGYLVELSADSEDYSVYLNRDTFSREDERPLLAELKQDHRPLVRLSRWPDAARCGLAITGDVDAFTIWDYGKRIFIH
jgi:peptidoglycan/xylan/chitin deacetylase (PgdA/CDA1 family)